MNKYVKFTGKFTDLIPAGWQFQKLFARNYRCYHKIVEEHSVTPDFWIWQHLGGYFEIADFFSLSYLFVEFIQSGRYLGVQRHERGYYNLVLNNNSYTFYLIER